MNGFFELKKRIEVFVTLSLSKRAVALNLSKDSALRQAQRDKRCVLLVGMALLTSGTVAAQSSVDRVLEAVARNNATLKADRQFYEARRAEYRTGLTPDNPFVEYDFLPGRPEGAGLQQEFSVTQSFDFPTAYARRRDVARRQTAQTVPFERVGRRQVLLEAKRVALELIYYNRRQVELDQRQVQALRLVEGVRQQLAQGAATALDVSKVELHRLTVENEQRVNAAERRTRELYLAELNGGLALSLPDTLYPPLPRLPDFATLDTLIEAADPEAAALRDQVELERRRTDLSRALTLPRLELGYHYQSLLGVRYQGVHAGLTLPLWQRRHTVQAQQANALTSEARLAEHRTEHHLRNQRVYEQYALRRTNVEQYRQALETLHTRTLLDTALRLRQLTTVEYLLETITLYAVTDTLQQAERDLHLTLAELMQYQL